MADAVAPFADRFCSKPVEIRTTTLADEQREVSFRFVDEEARGEVWKHARDWYGLTESPASFMQEVHAAFPLRAEGIDADVRSGFRKAWAFLTAGFRLERFAALTGAPPALRGVNELLTRFGLQHISIVGTDHHNGTCNLYPVLAPGWARAGLIEELAHALGFAPMDKSWLAGIEHSVAANFTFSWTSGTPLRLAFYRPAMTPDDVPDDRVLRKFAAECPVVAPERAYIPSIAYARSGHYRKLEVDYDGAIVGVLVRCAMVPPEA